MKNQLTDSLGFLIHDAGRLIRQRFEARGRTHGLSVAQWRLLVHLMREDSASQARIAELLEIEPISVSRLADRMEEAGWLERRSDPRDRRVRMLWPTEKAHAAFADVREMAGGVYDEAMRGLAPEERAHLIQGLKTIIANLGEADCRARSGALAGQGAAE